MKNDAVSTTLAGFPALRMAGSGGRPTLLFLHGAFTTHESFEPWMKRLAEAGWPSVAVSRRGRLGVGPERAKGVRVADYVEDTLRVIDALGAPPILVGHSLGGLIAQKIAEAGRARAIALLASAPAAMLTAQSVALPAYLPMMPKIMIGRPVLPSGSACARIALNRMPESERACIHQKLVHESGVVYRELMFGAIKVDASRVTCPVYVAGGAEDRIVSQALLRFSAERYGVEPRIFEGHAHWLLEEPGWERIADDLSGWLASAISGEASRAKEQGQREQKNHGVEARA